MDFSDRGAADAWVGKLKADHFFQLFANQFRDAFVAVWVQVPGYNEELGWTQLLQCCRLRGCGG